MVSTPPSDDADGRYIWLDPSNVMDDVPEPATVAATDGTDPGASFTFNAQDGNTGCNRSKPCFQQPSLQDQLQLRLAWMRQQHLLVL